jgi:hypothetical protein
MECNIVWNKGAEPNSVIYMSACLLLDPFQKYLEISVVFGLSICTATTNTSTVGNENLLLGFFLMGKCVWNSNKQEGLWVIAEKMKICSYLHVWKNPYW